MVAAFQVFRDKSFGPWQYESLCYTPMPITRKVVQQMSLESRVDKLETQVKILDENQHSLAKACADIKTIALTNQHDIAGLKVDVAGVKSDIAALTEAMFAGFRKADEQHNALVKEVRDNQKENRERFELMETRFDRMEKRFDRQEERFDQLELLIRQSLPKN